MLALIIPLSCSDTSPSDPNGDLLGPAPALGSGTMSASVTLLTQPSSVLQFSASNATATLHVDSLSIIATAAGSEMLVSAGGVNKVGTYVLGKYPSRAVYSRPPVQLWDTSGSSAGTGIVQITTLTSSRVAGKFSFNVPTLTTATSFYAGIDVANGKFDVMLSK